MTESQESMLCSWGEKTLAILYLSIVRKRRSGGETVRSFILNVAMQS